MVAAAIIFISIIAMAGSGVVVTLALRANKAVKVQAAQIAAMHAELDARGVAR